MRATVIAKFPRSSIDATASQMIHVVTLNQQLDGAVESFCQPVAFGIISRRERVVKIQYIADALEKLTVEASSFLGK